MLLPTLYVQPELKTVAASTMATIIASHFFFQIYRLPLQVVEPEVKGRRDNISVYKEKIE